MRREGAYYGITQFMYKIASGVSIALVSLLLEAFGYEESMDGSVLQQPEEALMAVRVVLGVLPGIIFLISIIFSHKANMGRERFDMIKEELRKRHEQAALAAESGIFQAGALESAPLAEEAPAEKGADIAPAEEPQDEEGKDGEVRRAVIGARKPSKKERDE